MFPFLLAHGALGWFDELIYLAFAATFVAMMIVSWLQSRGAADALEESTEGISDATDADEDRFRLD